MVETKTLEKSHQISDFLQIHKTKEQKSTNLKKMYMVLIVLQNEMKIKSQSKLLLSVHT